MALTRYAAPKPQRVTLPTVPVNVGGFTSLEPKPTAANFYQAPASSGLPAPVTPRATTPYVPANPDLFQLSAPPGVDYGAMLAADPTLSGQLGAINDQEAANRVANTNMQNRGFIQYGTIPDFTGPTSSLIGDLNVDQATRDLASAGTASGVSTSAVRDKSLVDARQSYLASLAARNMIQSGAVGQHEGEVLSSYQQGTYQDLQQLADYLISLHQDWLAQLSQGNASRADATKQALDRIIAQVSALEAKRQADAAAKQAAYEADLAKNAYGLNGNPYADFRFQNDPSYPQIGDTTGGGGGGGGIDIGSGLQTLTPALRAAINQSPNALQNIGSDAAQGGWSDPYSYAPTPGVPGGYQSNFTPAETAAINQSPNALQYLGSDAAQGGWSDPARSTQDVTPPDYQWGQSDEPLYDPYYNPDPVIEQPDYSQVDPNLLAIGNYGGYKQSMYY